MAPHWFKGTIMQLLVSSQTPLAALNHSNVALRGTVKEETRRVPTPLHPPIPDPRPPRQPKHSSQIRTHPAWGTKCLILHKIPGPIRKKNVNRTHLPVIPLGGNSSENDRTETWTLSWHRAKGQFYSAEWCWLAQRERKRERASFCRPHKNRLLFLSQADSCHLKQTGSTDHSLVHMYASRHAHT